MANPQVADGGMPPVWGYLRIYGIGSRGQPTRVSPPSSVLGEVLTTPHRKNWPCYETEAIATDLN